MHLYLSLEKKIKPFLFRIGLTTLVMVSTSPLPAVSTPSSTTVHYYYKLPSTVVGFNFSSLESGRVLHGPKGDQVTNQAFEALLLDPPRHPF